MAGIGGVVIQFRAKADQALRETKKLARNLDDVGRQSEKTGKKFTTMAKVGILGVAGAAAGAGKALFDMAQMAAEDRTQQLKLENVLRNVTTATEDQIAAVGGWIDSMELATEVADTELRESLTRLASATGDVTTAQDLLAVAVDTSAARGESLETVVRALEKAVGGNTNALKRQMPWLDANNDGVVTLDEAVRGLEEAYGGAANEAAKANGPMQELAIQWERMQEALGGALLPALDDLTEWLQSPEGQAAVEGWVAAVGQFADNMSDLSDEVAPAVNLFKKLIDVWNSLPGPLRFVLSRGSATGLFQAEGAFQDKKARTSDAANRAKASASGSTTTIIVNNPAPERGSDSIASALRTRRLINPRDL